jgi:hypothetical protein
MFRMADRDLHEKRSRSYLHVTEWIGHESTRKEPKKRRGHRGEGKRTPWIEETKIPPSPFFEQTGASTTTEQHRSKSVLLQKQEEDEQRQSTKSKGSSERHNGRRRGPTTRTRALSEPKL